MPRGPHSSDLAAAGIPGEAPYRACRLHPGDGEGDACRVSFQPCRSLQEIVLEWLHSPGAGFTVNADREHWSVEPCGTRLRDWQRLVPVWQQADRHEPARLADPARCSRPSRFRVRVQRVVAGLRPYGWEIYDAEDGRPVRRSAGR